jgi:Fe2+ or Zn2+ uptake regulation protein
MDEKPDFKQLLRSRGFKATPGRIGLLSVLWSAGAPLTVEDLAKRQKLNIVTLYRALETLANEGLLLRGNGDDGVAHFSYPRGMHHHHLMCMDCGFIKTCTKTH